MDKSETGFLAETNDCGQTLLRLVSRGNSLIAEILRLSKHIPDVFLLTNLEIKNQYQFIVHDYSYDKSPDFIENKISNNGELLERDQELKESSTEIVERFYNLFQSIHKYITDFLQYLRDIDDGVFIQYNLVSIIQNFSGKQLMAEAVYLYGVTLLLLDQLIEGPVRERIIISYIRYTGNSPDLDDTLAAVKKLMASTGFFKSQYPKKPANYPESFFGRIPIPSKVVQLLVDRLRSDDIYKQIPSYSSPFHRSTALAQQACMLYVILFFEPTYLKTENAVMREIVDRFFPDNWIINYYLGFTVDLSISWTGYKAAQTALSNTLQPTNVQKAKTRNFEQLEVSMKELKHHLQEGILREEYILDNVQKLLDVQRNANVTLRWMMLHTTSADKKIQAILVPPKTDPKLLQDRILGLLLDTAQFEYLLKNSFKKMLHAKQVKFGEIQKSSALRMKRLSDYFTGEQPLTDVKRDESLMKWFAKMEGEINNLDFGASSTGRRIDQIIRALTKVQGFHQISRNRTVIDFLAETVLNMKQMLRTLNLDEDQIIDLQIISDLAYAWEIVEQYVIKMQEIVKRNPFSVLKLRATFIKLSTLMHLPLLRIQQASSPDFESVTDYYSLEVVKFVRRVLDIVPRSMFELLSKIIKIQTSSLREVPPKVDKNDLITFAQLPTRLELARLTQQVSVFTEGLLSMEEAFYIGIKPVDPKELLEEGIRKQLVEELVNKLHSHLQFTVKGLKIEDWMNRLRGLRRDLFGMNTSFQYIQDYISVYGLKIWQEELTRVINYHVERETNQFLKKKVFDWDSPYQSEAIPIKTPPLAATAVKESVAPYPLGAALRTFTPLNFVGRLTRELLVFTHPRTTTFYDQLAAYFDTTGREIINIRSFDLLTQSIGVAGATGVDKLLAFMIVKELQTLVINVRAQVEPRAAPAPTKKGTNNNNNQKPAVAQFVTEDIAQVLQPTTSTPKDNAAHIKGVQRGIKLWPVFLEVVLAVGQLQLLRRQIASSLNFSCKLDAGFFYHSLETMNRALLNDIQAHSLDTTKPYPVEKDSPLVTELSRYAESSGITDPFKKIYITTKPIDNYALLVFLFVLSQIDKFQFNSQLGITLHRKDKFQYDVAPFVVGIITLLKQFHSTHTQKFLAYMCQYVRSQINTDMKDPKKQLADLSPTVISVLLFLEDFCHFSHFGREAVEGYLPSYIFDQFTHLGK